MKTSDIKSKAEKEFSAAGGRMVKYKGVVASIAPLSSVGKKISFNPGIFSLMTGIGTSLSAILLAAPGETGICQQSQNPYTYECSGPADPSTDADILISPQQNVDRLFIDIAEGFRHESTTTEESVGIEISDGGKAISGITYTDNNQGYVKASHYALGIESESRGDITISSNGEFYSENSIGVVISNNEIANVNATFHKITGKDSGLFLNNKESVTSQLTTTGEIQGEENAGILALAEGGELTLNANGNVTGRSGIVSVGFTSSTVTATGDVVGKNLEGIFSNVTSTGTDLIINAHNVTGALRGILTDSYGSGDTSITTTGLVKGETEHGIWAAHRGKNLNIQVNDVMARGHGIHIENTLAKGNINVNSTGKITADETGVYTNLETPSYRTAINVNDIIAGYQGIYAKHQGEGVIGVSISGNVEVNPTAFQSSQVITEDGTRCLVTENNPQCGVVEIDTNGDASVKVSGNVITGNSTSAPKIIVDLKDVDGVASLNIHDAGRIYGQSVTRTGDSDDELIFSGNTLSHQINLADIGNENAEFAFIGFDKLIKRDAGKLSLHGKQSSGAFHSVEFYGGDIDFNDITLLLKDKKSVLTAARNSKINITGNTGSDITGSVINHGTISLRNTNGSPGTHILNIGGALTNEGTITTKDNFVGNQIIVQGDYVASNDNILQEDPHLILEATLNDDGSPADKLIIRGNSSGHTALQVVPVITPGAKTVDGIPVIEVSGFSDATFALETGDYQNDAGEWALIGGAYSYTLEKSGRNWHLTSYETSGSSGNSNDEEPVEPVKPNVPGPDINLPGVTEGPETPVNQDPDSEEMPSPQKPEVVPPQKRKLQPGVAVAMSASEHFLFLNRSASLHQRIGGRHDNLFKTASKSEFQSTSWVNIDDSRTNYDEKTTDSKNSHNATKIGFGFDFATHPHDTRYVVGLNGFVQKSGVNSKSKSGYGNINTQSYGIGATGTAYVKDTYIDVQAKYYHLSSDLVSQELGVIAENQKGKGYGFSIETGHRIKGSAQWHLTPQLQLSYSKTSVNSFKDFKNNKFEFSDVNELRLRLGADLDKKISDGKGETYIYGKANLHHQLQDAPAIRIAGTEFISDIKDTTAELIMGGEYRVKNTGTRLYGEVRLASDIGSLTDVANSSVNIGTTISW